MVGIKGFNEIPGYAGKYVINKDGVLYNTISGKCIEPKVYGKMTQLGYRLYGHGFGLHFHNITRKVLRILWDMKACMVLLVMARYTHIRIADWLVQVKQPGLHTYMLSYIKKIRSSNIRFID